MGLERNIDADMDRSLSRRVRGALRWTHAGLWLERLSQAFWPLLTALATLTGLALLGVQEALPSSFHTPVFLSLALILFGLMILGLWRFKRPLRGAAMARVDATLDGRPLQALRDVPVQRGDTQIAGIWAEHRRRMQARLSGVRPVSPQPHLARKDPFALRLMGLTVLGMGLVFGSWDRARSVVERGGQADALAQGPIWEGWVKPPAYSGKPMLYLGDLNAGFEAPKGADVTVRFYAEDGVLSLRETVSDAETNLPDFLIQHAGEIEIDGPTGRLWQVALQPDAHPEAELTGEMSRAPSGEMRLPFRALDDYGVARVVLTITRDTEAVERRYGFARAPEDRPAIEINVPLPQTGARGDIEGLIAENLSQHPFAGLPVQLSLMAWDEAEQTSAEALGEGILPARKFFDPLAAAIVDLRRELLWNRDNAARTAQVLRAVSVGPEEVFDDMADFTRLREVVDHIEARDGRLKDAEVEEIATALWDIALELEDGELKEALERLHRAQERLTQAMRDGASDEEIARLMQELREATRDYMQQLAEQQGESGDGMDEPDRGERQRFTDDQLQELMDRIQELMEQGRMAEAQQLLDMLAQMLENMRVERGEGEGDGNGSQGMQELQDTLREQQELNDDTFSELQNRFGQPSQQEGEGEAGSSEAPSLSERQGQLREELGQKQGRMPSGGGQDGPAGAMDQAGRAMDEAEDRLKEGDLPGALERQAEAMEALREGLRRMREEAQSQQSQEGQQGTSGGRDGKEIEGRDPLGRTPGETGRLGSDDELYEGENVERRAEELLDEIRRRSAEQARPQEERDYLNRLLDRF